MSYKKRPSKKRSGKLLSQTHLRDLTSAEKSYLEELRLYDNVLDVTMLISLNQHGIMTDGRGLRAIRIFTRQTGLGLSLGRILPRPKPERPHDGEHWDLTAAASLSRGILEGHLGLHYFGTEKVSTEEAELRFFILQLHRNVEWYEIRKLRDPNDPSLKEFEEGFPSERDRIKNHPYMPHLTEAQRKRALRGIEMYSTKSDFEKDLPVCRGLRANYRLLSNLIHPLPLSIERVDSERGRGLGSDADVNICLLCIVLARRFLAASTVDIADLFPNQLASRFVEKINGIRPLILEA